MGFFTSVSKVLDRGADLNITIAKAKTGDRIVVSVLPVFREDSDIKMVPLNITGTKEELDQGFLPELKKMRDSVSGLTSSFQQFQKATAKETEKVAKNGKKASSIKTKTETPKKPQKELF